MKRLLIVALLTVGCHTPVPPPQPPPPPPPPPAPVYTDTGERGAVHVSGITMVRDNGSTFQWRGITGFRLYEQWLLGRVGITNVVENWVSCGGLCAPGEGPNVVRVLGMVDSFAHLWPQEHPDYYDQIGPFVDYLWFTWHLRVEFVIFADAQIIMPNRMDENSHALRVISNLMGHPGVAGVEVVNEPFKNIPGGGQTAAEIGRTLIGRGLNISSGDYGDDPMLFLDYITRHGDRGPEWVRKIKDSLDYRDAFGKPVIDDEPMGAGETDGRRSTNESDFAQFAAGCQLFSVGCTYHSENGIEFRVFQPIQQRIAGAFFQAIRFIPVDAQFASYKRGGETGCNWVGGESLVEHDDALELRTFGKQIGDQAWIVQFRTIRGAPTPCPGWTVSQVLRPGIVRVNR